MSTPRPDKVREQVLRAIRYAEEGRYPDAARIFRALVAEDPRSPVHRLNLGCLYLNNGRIPQAIEELGAACRLGPADPNAFYNLGLAYYRVDALARAAECFAAAVRLNPGYAPAAVMASLSLSRIGRVPEARALCPPAEADRVLDPELRNLLSLALKGIGQEESAESVLRRLLADVPGHHSAAINLADTLELANKAEQAAALLAGIPEDGFDTFGRIVQARVQRRLGQTEQAEATLRAVLESPGVPAQQQSIAQFEYGKCMDSSGRYAEAVSAFEQGNRLIRDFIGRENGVDQNQELEWLHDVPQIDGEARRRAALAPPDLECPVFVIGFPRSGTTLIDQILDSHPALQVLEEKPALENAVDLLEQRYGPYPESLRRLQARDLDTLRAEYWGTVGRFLQRRTGARLVDKYPFNFTRIHLIMALFPAAKLIFVTRHPCDVVLSCFMQNFGFANASRGFWSIGESANIYCQAITVWLEQRARLQPPCLDLWYEDLVRDLPPQVERITAFLDIPASAGMLEFHKHAQTRRINTPSYSQVVKPLYRSSVERWQAYRPWFAEVEAPLLQLAARLGYPRPLAA